MSEIFDEDTRSSELSVLSDDANNMMWKIREMKVDIETINFMIEEEKQEKVEEICKTEILKELRALRLRNEKLENVVYWLVKEQKVQSRKLNKILSIDRKKPGKNWDDLTDNLKKKCIEYLDFSDRMRLRATSRTERCHVDSLRFQFYEVLLFGKYNLATVLSDSGKSLKLKNPTDFSHFDREHQLKNLTVSLIYILKFCDIENLIIYDLPEIDWIVLEQIEEYIPKEFIRIRHFYSKYYVTPTLILLEKCWCQMESVRLKEYDPNVKTLTKVPQAIASYQFDITSLSTVWQFNKFIKTWIGENDKLGSQLIIRGLGRFKIKNFKKKFHRKILHNGDNSEILMGSGVARRNVIVSFPLSTVMTFTVVESGL